MIKSLCRRMCGEEWEDAAQLVRLQLWKKLDSYRGESSFTTWMYRVTVNICLMYVRDVKGKKLAKVVSLDELVENHAFDKASTDPSPLRAAIAREVIDKLSERETNRKFLGRIHTRMEGHTPTDSARILGITLPAAKARLCHARRALRKALEAKESESIQRGQRLPLSDRQAEMKARHMAAGLTI